MVLYNINNDNLYLYTPVQQGGHIINTSPNKFNINDRVKYTDEAQHILGNVLNRPSIAKSTGTVLKIGDNGLGEPLYTVHMTIGGVRQIAESNLTRSPESS